MRGLSDCVAAPRTSTLRHRPRVAEVHLLPYWEDANKIDEPGAVLLWATAALAWAALCHDKGMQDDVPDYLLLTRQYLDRYRTMPRACVDKEEWRDSLNTLATYIAVAVLCYKRKQPAKGREAVALATEELRRYFSLTSWNSRRQLAL